MQSNYIAKGAFVLMAGWSVYSPALAGGLERGGYNIDLLFDRSPYAAEATATYVMPQRKLKNACDRVMALQLAEDRIILPHASEDALVVDAGGREADRDGTDIEIEDDLLGCAQPWVIPIEPACGPERWVSGER